MVLVAYQLYDYYLTRDDVIANLMEHASGWVFAFVASTAWHCCCGTQSQTQPSSIQMGEIAENGTTTTTTTSNADRGNGSGTSNGGRTATNVRARTGRLKPSSSSSSSIPVLVAMLACCCCLPAPVLTAQNTKAASALVWSVYYPTFAPWPATLSRSGIKGELLRDILPVFRSAAVAGMDWLSLTLA